MDSDTDDQFQLNMQRDEESKAYEKSVKAQRNGLVNLLEIALKE